MRVSENKKYVIPFKSKIESFTRVMYELEKFHEMTRLPIRFNSISFGKMNSDIDSWRPYTLYRTVRFLHLLLFFLTGICLPLSFLIRPFINAYIFRLCSHTHTATHRHIHTYKQTERHNFFFQIQSIHLTAYVYKFYSSSMQTSTVNTEAIC